MADEVQIAMPLDPSPTRRSAPHVEEMRKMPAGSGTEAPKRHRLLFHKTIRIAVSGDVRLSELEIAIIDTPEFQRLRNIQQLGTSSWVYPTAVHTRFDHSIGVLSVVDDMISRIREAKDHVAEKRIAPEGVRTFEISEEQRILARLYALLHDITHVPFGHTIEDELNIFSSHDAFQAEASADKGLDRFDKMLGSSSRIAGLIRSHLDERMYARFIEIFMKGKHGRLRAMDAEGETYDEFIYYLVSDTVCADLIDYLSRDSYFCDLGLRVPKRILNYLYVADVSPQGGEVRRRVVVRLWKPRDGEPRTDVMTDISAILDSRYLLAERVYFHHTKVTVGTMLGRSVLEAKIAGALSAEDMLNYGDQTLLSYLAGLGKPGEVDDEPRSVASRLARAVRDRSLYERIRRYSKDAFPSSGKEGPFEELIAAFESAAGRRQIEDELAEVAGVKPGDILIYVANPNMNLKIAKAIVDFEGKHRTLKDLKQPVIEKRLSNIEESHRHLWRAELLGHPSLTETQKEKARLLFEAKFFPRGERKDKYYGLLNTLVTESSGFGNRDRSATNEAVRKAADELASDLFEAAHNRKPVDILLDAVRKHI